MHQSGGEVRDKPGWKACCVRNAPDPSQRFRMPGHSQAPGGTRDSSVYGPTSADKSNQPHFLTGRAVFERSTAPWTLLLPRHMQGGNQYKKCHYLKPESIAAPLRQQLFVMSVRLSQRSAGTPCFLGLWMVLVLGLYGFLNAQREVGPWHAETSPGDSSFIYPAVINP